MPEHKMIEIDGIRVREEDADRYRARVRPGAGARPLTRTLADPSAETAPPAEFDPSGHNVDDVLAHLADASEAETARVLDAEADGKGRKSLTEQREQLLAAARERAAGDGSGGDAAS